MRRLKLNLEALTVESFSTDEALRRRGTVYGREDTAEGDPSWPEGTCVETCTPYRTTPNTCRWSCDDLTCWWTCDTGPCNCGEETDTGACTIEA